MDRGQCNGSDGSYRMRCLICGVIPFIIMYLMVGCFRSLFGVGGNSCTRINSAR